MRRTILASMTAFLALSAPVVAAPPDDFSDAAVEAAIKRGAESLWSQQAADGSWPGGRVGPTAMAVYALLESGVSAQNEPRMVKALEWLKSQKSTGTYDLGLRAQAYLAAMKKGAPYQQELAADVQTLVKSTADGSYTYVSDGTPRAGDHSNSQYGLLGVWAGALAHLEGIPKEYWQKVMIHWLNAQNDDGGWIYNGGGGAGPSSHTMTAAGVATLFVCFDNLFAESFINCNLGEKGRLVQAPIKRGMDWFDKNFDATVTRNSWLFYYLYGVERVGLASGYKYFGTTDWYKKGALTLLKMQAASGAWNGDGGLVPCTSWAMLFLIRGRRPILMNKLEFVGDWNNRPRDLAYLTGWVSEKFETDVFWQIINLKVPPREWHDAPILYIAACREAKFSDDDLDKLRQFVYQGGTIFSLTEGNGPGFQAGIRRDYDKLFPRYKLTRCEPNHEIYSVQYKLNRMKGQFYMISNGVRPLVIHTDVDLAKSWQLQRTTTDKEAFEAVANIYMYVTDRSLRPRGSKLWPEEPTIDNPAATVKLARIQFDGNWDPEPLAYEHFTRLMGEKHKVKVEVIPAVTLDKLVASGAKLATLTGTGKLDLDEPQREALKQFVENGGTLVVDAAGGDRDFQDSAEKLLEKTYPGMRLGAMQSDDPVLKLKDMEIHKAKYRRRTRMRIRNEKVNLRVLRIGDRPGVIFSREDLTAGLVGYPSYTVDGYEPDSAFEIMRNIVLYAEANAPQANAPAPDAAKPDAAKPDAPKP